MRKVNIFTKMITMDIKQQILHYYRVEGLSIRAIARELHIDRKTVQRLIVKYEEAITKDPETGMDTFLATVPKYAKRKSIPNALRDKLSIEIDKLLKENERRKSAGMRKQCLKRKDIHAILIEKGFDVSYSSVCKYIAKKKEPKAPKTKDVYLRIHREPGEECEFDWGEVKLFINKVQTTFMMAVFAFPYSKGRYAYLFHRQDTLAFMESHRNFFKEVQGVPQTMVYDNMKVAVVLEKDGKKPTTALSRMSNFYKYQFRFCNARAGWEKGNVERSVDVVRNKAFSRIVDFETVEEAQLWLDKKVAELNAENGSICTSDKIDKLHEDLECLNPYPGEFGCFEIAEYKVDKQSTICIGSNHYSVPDYLAGKSVFVKVYSNKIAVIDDEHNIVATHERSYLSNQWIVDINHYLDTLIKKPAAVQHSEAFHRMPIKLQAAYNKHFKSNPKEFLMVLKYVKANDITSEELLEAIAVLYKRGVRKFTADQIKVALRTLAAGNEEYTEEQQTDQFIEIEIGSEDILNQLENVMENGAKLAEGGAR